jgi:hypothetical protein
VARAGGGKKGGIRGKERRGKGREDKTGVNNGGGKEEESRKEEG